jgi:transposase
MSAPIPLRRDFDASQLRSLAKKTKDGPQARRLLALAAIYDGVARTEAAKIGGVGLQIIRDWVLHFNERGPDGLLNGKSPGQASKLNDVQRQAIARIIESGPIPAVHGVVRWRLIDLAQWIFEEFRITIAKQTLSRELRAMGYRRLLARPRHHAQAEGSRDRLALYIQTTIQTEPDRIESFPFSGVFTSQMDGTSTCMPSRAPR